jgi:hypothetical protein
VCAIFYVSNAIGVPLGSLYAAFMLCETAVFAVIAPHLDDLLACYMAHTWKGCWKYVDCRYWLLKKYLGAQAAAEDSNALVFPRAVGEGGRAAVDGVASSVQSNHPKITKLNVLERLCLKRLASRCANGKEYQIFNFNLPLLPAEGKSELPKKHEALTKAWSAVAKTAESKERLVQSQVGYLTPLNRC